MKLLVTALLTLVSSLESSWAYGNGGYHPRRYGFNRGAFNNHAGHVAGGGAYGNNRRMINGQQKHRLAAFGNYGRGRHAKQGQHLVKDMGNRAYDANRNYGLNSARTGRAQAYMNKQQAQLQGLNAHQNAQYGRQGKRFLDRADSRRNALKRNREDRRYRNLRKNRQEGLKKNYQNRFNNGASVNNQYKKSSNINFNKNSSQNNVSLSADTDEWSNNNTKDYKSGDVLDNNSNYINNVDEQQKMGRHVDYMNRANLYDGHNKRGASGNAYRQNKHDKRAILRNNLYNKGAHNRAFDGHNKKYGQLSNRAYANRNRLNAANAYSGNAYARGQNGKYGAGAQNYLAAQGNNYGKRFGRAHKMGSNGYHGQGGYGGHW